ncbi:MAG: GMC oxidoreductase [Patulibacter minatonensis]
MLSRRAFLTGATAGAALLAAEAASAEPLPTGAGGGSLLQDLMYRSLVPELYATPPALPSTSEVVIIGSGFGAAVTALRLVQAGVTVHMLERGSRWPKPSPWRQTFSGDVIPDGRALWHRRKFTGANGIPLSMHSFGGVLDATDYDHIQVWRGAAVGGGSIVFTGALVQPERRFFDHVFSGTGVSYEELDRLYYPRALAMLRGSTMPADVYGSAPFGHSRAWDKQARAAGYAPQAIASSFRWDVIRSELRGTSRKSATIGETNYGNSNGAKHDLTQNYLREAEATGRLVIHPRHVVHAIGSDARGYWIDYSVVRPNGSEIRRTTARAGRLFLGAGSVGTSELLVRARSTGALANLSEHTGAGWGTNGDAALVQKGSPSGGMSQAAPSASRILDEGGDTPVSLENWYVPGMPINVPMIGSLGMALDDTRAAFRFDAEADRVVLDWPKNGNAGAIAALEATHRRVVAAAEVTPFFTPSADPANAAFTAHPLGGAVLGKVTDTYGRVLGHPGLYVTDGAAIPGSTGTANPSLTIAALAERNVAAIIAARG